MCCQKRLLISLSSYHIGSIPPARELFNYSVSTFNRATCICKLSENMPFNSLPLNGFNARETIQMS